MRVSAKDKLSSCQTSLASSGLRKKIILHKTVLTREGTDVCVKGDTWRQMGVGIPLGEEPHLLEMSPFAPALVSFVVSKNFPSDLMKSCWFGMAKVCLRYLIISVNRNTEVYAIILDIKQNEKFTPT